MALLLSEADVKALVPMPRLIDAMESALVAYSSGHVEQPVRSIVDVGKDRNFFGVMPAYIGETEKALGAKLVTFFESNMARGIPTHFATIVLLDPETGLLQAVLDGRYLTEARTAAVSAISAKWLARSDASRLAIIGSGVQARSHLEALGHVRKFDHIAAWSPNRANLTRFCDETGVHSADSAEQAVSDADVVVTATAAREPIVFNRWIRRGTHVIAVGACRPTHRELEGALVARARFFVDSRQASTPRSRRALAFELQRRGVDRDLVAETVAPLSDLDGAYNAARRRLIAQRRL